MKLGLLSAYKLRKMSTRLASSIPRVKNESGNRIVAMEIVAMESLESMLVIGLVVVNFPAIVKNLLPLFTRAAHLKEDAPPTVVTAAAVNPLDKDHSK